MSIKSALESEGIDFSEYMNPPEPWNGQALLRNINGVKYACCPFCQKKALLISPSTKIQHLWRNRLEDFQLEDGKRY